MTGIFTITRRRLLLAIAAVAPAALGWVGQDRMFRLRATVEAMLNDLPGARAIGARYLALEPGEGDAALLARILFPQQVGDDHIRETLDEQRQRDFGAGDTVLIDGWILARTEARLCALTALA